MTRAIHFLVDIADNNHHQKRHDVYGLCKSFLSGQCRYETLTKNTAKDSRKDMCQPALRDPYTCSSPIGEGMKSFFVAGPLLAKQRN